jgi:hypothetical protein
MKVRLMHQDRDFDLHCPFPGHADDLSQDLALDTLFAALGGGDDFLLDVARHAVFVGLDDPAAIVYRQDILRDCLAHPEVLDELYGIAVEAITGEKKVYRPLLNRRPDAIVHRSITVLQLFMGLLRRIRTLADERAAEFTSAGFSRFFAMIEDELSDAYFAEVDDHLRRLRFRGGALVSAVIGADNRGADHTLRTPIDDHPSFLDRIRGRATLSLQIADRDEAGAEALAELRGRGINPVADALARSTDHILSFFELLRAELGFYVGCLQLHAQLAAKGEPTCFPTPRPAGDAALSFTGLYDVCLSLSIRERVVGNDVDADGRSLIMVTGANQGGKSTFLRSVGLAQLMMQSGMFAPAESFTASVAASVFTHYKREEDVEMESGKFDEELARMSGIADAIGPTGLLLGNESFASTNEREGSEVARNIIRAMVDRRIRVVFVTHLFDLAHSFHTDPDANALFLRAPRQADGRRPFKLIVGEPLPTSYGVDLYRNIFGADDASADVASATAADGAR